MKESDEVKAKYNNVRIILQILCITNILTSSPTSIIESDKKIIKMHIIPTEQLNNFKLERFLSFPWKYISTRSPLLSLSDSRLPS